MYSALSERCDAVLHRPQVTVLEDDEAPTTRLADLGLDDGVQVVVAAMSGDLQQRVDLRACSLIVPLVAERDAFLDVDIAGSLVLDDIDSFRHSALFQRRQHDVILHDVVPDVLAVMLRTTAQTEHV